MDDLPSSKRPRIAIHQPVMKETSSIAGAEELNGKFDFVMMYTGYAWLTIANHFIFVGKS